MDEGIVLFVMWEKGEGERGDGKENQLSGASLPAAMFSAMSILGRILLEVDDWGLFSNCQCLHYPQGICTLLGRP